MPLDEGAANDTERDEEKKNQVMTSIFNIFFERVERYFCYTHLTFNNAKRYS